MRLFIKVILILSLSFLYITVYSQKSQIYIYPEKDFNRGMEFFRKEKYGIAQRFFNKSLESQAGIKTDMGTQAQYYIALCAIELSNEDAEYLVDRFIGENQESPLVNNALFSLADYLFRKNSFAAALKYLSKVDKYFLEKDDLSQYYYQRGYSHFMRKNYSEARVSFYEIKDIESKYSIPALYYYSHIAYEEKNYETALNGFLRLLDDETFSSAAPYYITQIYYLQKKYSEVIEFAPSLMEKISEKRSPEMAKIIGESYFYLNRYNEALPYLEKYRNEIKNISIEDKYQLAYTYYKTSNYKSAVALFEQTSMGNTEISQSSLYHLADCFIKLGDTQRARTAFAGAARMNFDPGIQEDALFNFAKVTYELSYSPFNEAIRAFNAYINLYPASGRTDEAYNFLVMAYLNTRNYKMALESLEKIKVRDRFIDKAYQRVAFFRGMELYTNLRFTDALITFDKSLQYSIHDPVIKARTFYWLAESYYRLNDINSASEFYQLFLADEYAPGTPEFKMLNYSLGYLSFNERKYSESEKWFSMYVKLEPDKNAVTFADAYNRLGDCRFIEKAYWQAIEYYDKVIDLQKADVPYALFQKGFSLGLVDRPQRKIEVLNQLLVSYPASSYTDDALFELGRTWVLVNKPEEAKTNYQKIITDYPNSSYISRTLTQLGLIHKNSGENNKALEYYKKVVEEYPGTSESANALRSIREIFVEINKVDEYLAYVEKVGKAVTIPEQDSLIYYAAENVYLSGDCQNAIPGLDNYIARFPSGGFLLNAHYYRADCLLRQNNPDSAFPSLEYIISQPVNLFTEPALHAATKIAFAKEDFNLAAQLFQQLIEKGEKEANIREAEIGLMRCYAQLGEFRNTIQASRQVLIQDKLQEEIKREATYLIADAYLKQNDPLAAYEWYVQIANEVKSREGAEAKYRLSEIDYNRGEVEKAEKNIYEFIDLNTPHSYWMGKAFLLLADIFISANDEFQALQTLQSVIDYYTSETDGIKDEARKKKQIINDSAKEEPSPVNEENNTESVK